MNTSIQKLIAALVISTAGTVACGQVMQLQGGSALDSNYQVGSGGYNIVNGGTGGVNSQLYVTGQVTGLGGFHGKVPSEATNQLRVNSVSPFMDRFNGQSVNLRQVLQGNTYRASPYYNGNLTVFGVPGIVTGVTAPGTSAPPGQTSAVAVQRAYTDVTKEYRQVIPMIPGMVVALPPGYMTDLPINVPQPVSPTNTMGMMEYQEKQQLAQELQLLDQTSVLGANSPDGTRPQEGDLSTLDNALNQGNAQGVGGVGGMSTRGARRQANGQDEISLSTRGGRVSMAPSNQDVYMDLLLQLKQQREQNANRQWVKPVQTLQPAAAVPGTSAQPGGTDETANGTEQAPGQAAQGTTTSIVEGGPGGVVVHGLAGLSHDLFNVYMNRAQNNLKQGKYYEANKDFEVATVVNEANPLSRIGSTLALFAAGEPFTASGQLKRGMQVLPPLMETRLDIPAMMNVTNVREELKKLDERIAEQPQEKMLVFLSTFLHYNLGDTEEAKAYAKKLETLAGSDTLLAVFAHYVQTGQRPSGSAAVKAAPAGKAPAAK